MSGRVRCIVFIISILNGLVVLPAAAQSGRTFYIDYSNGSNSNNGTAKSSAWKSHPYMQTGAGCTGTGSAPAYSHQPGDRFVFQGGVTWPSACFPMEINGGGSSNTVRDIYTADQSWYVGSAFAKANFSGNGATLNHVVSVNASNVTLSYLDMGGYRVSNNPGGCTGTINVPSGMANVMASYVYLHDWQLNSPTDMSGHAIGGLCSGMYITQKDNNIVLDHSDVRDDGNIVNGASVPVGVCGKSIHIAFTHCHYLIEGIVGHGAVHDSEFDHITWGGLSLDNGGAHGNIIEADTYNGDGPVYNNFLHDNTEGVNIFETSIANVYNNVIYNHYWNAAIMIDTEPNQNPTSSTANVYNNTVKCDTSSDTRAVRVFDRGAGKLGTLNMKNNVFIACTIDTAAASTVNSVTNTSLSLAQMVAQGLSVTTGLVPNLNSGLSQGTNMSTLCTGADSSGYSFALLCKDIVAVGRPLGSPWSIGAYEIGGQTSQTSKPNPPSNLAATVQ